MTRQAILTELKALSAAERIQLVQDLWDSVVDEGHPVPLSEAQRAELDRRLEAYEADPDAGSSWEEVRARLRKKA